jgi:hypothetical protein
MPREPVVVTRAVPVPGTAAVEVVLAMVTATVERVVVVVVRTFFFAVARRMVVMVTAAVPDVRGGLASGAGIAETVVVAVVVAVVGTFAASDAPRSSLP